MILGEIGKILGERWKALSEEEKKVSLILFFLNPH